MAEKPCVKMQAGEVNIDSDPGVLGAMFHNLITNEEYRAAFEKDPVSFLAEVGVEVPEELGRRITPENIDAAIDQLSEGAGPERAVAAIAAPGVAPAIRVGTRPGTRPGVNVGVRVVTGSSTFAVRDPRQFETMEFEKIQEIERRER